ncbi:MAG TPA: histidine kinase dimerization/phospho-acceptor domain-containing protein, partial [Puia sp.]|nr:histidine kinase dimerization/phospho-acceptor domain-containing protein [Puia sp.]
MSMRLKTKLSLGLIFLFTVILSFGILGLININLLSRDANLVLKNNHESLVYANNMLKALEVIRIKKDADSVFEENLKKQENNITEVGEKEATQELRKNFNELLANPADSTNYPEIRQSIIQIQDLNEMAILRKNAVAQKTAENAKMWLTVIFTILTLVAFTFIFNLPGIISKPISTLSEGISEIANKNYKKRIFLQQEDEFGDLANSFNVMAAKLDEYENSNLSKIKFEKSRIETIINQMRDGIIGLDDKKNILFLNAVAEKLLGLKEADIIGKYAPDIALKNDLMRTLLVEEEDKKDLKIYAENKESFFNKDTLKVTNNDQVVGLVIVLRNITPFHELIEAKTNFIATVSHELKTPISSIKMSAQLLNDNRVGELNNEQEELVQSIRDDSERLLKITGELLNISQAETGQIQLNVHAVDPKKIISNAVEAMKKQALQKNIALELVIPDQLPMVEADDEKTGWVLTNFLSNAIRYSYEQSKVVVSAEVLDGVVQISVADSGQGIPAAYTDKIFNRYFRVPGTKKEGTGLGLAISKDFIE